MAWYKRQNKSSEAVKSGAEIDFEAGSRLEIAGVAVTASASELNTLDGITASTAELNILDGVIRTAAQINALVQGVAAGYKVARVLHTTVAASDDVDTGLATVVAAVATLEDAPSTDPLWVQAVVGDQVGTPAAGHVLVKSWKPTAVNDVTPIAATTFGKKVSVIAVGT